MKLITFHRINTFQTLDEALAHANRSMPGQVKRCCGEENDGYHCTLFQGHSGDHEAWGIGRVKMEYSWANINHTTNH